MKTALYEMYSGYDIQIMQQCEERCQNQGYKQQ